MDKGFALLLGYSILHHSHISKLAQQFKEDDGEVPHKLPEYVEFLYEGIVNYNTDILCGRMRKVYEKICDRYIVGVTLSKEETVKSAETYQKIVFKNKGKITEANDATPETKNDDLIFAARAHSDAHQKTQIVDLAFIQTDWNAHFRPFERSLEELKQIRTNLNQDIIRVERVLRENRLIMLATIAIPIGAVVAAVLAFKDRLF